MPHIRPIAIAIIQHGDNILVFEAYDPIKGETFYRPLGGGIEFGERGEEAVLRELREEAGIELTNVRYLETLENIFTVRGQPSHEMVLLYAADLADPHLYEVELLNCVEDDGSTFCAMWKPLAYFRASHAPLYPDGLLEYIDGLSAVVTEKSPTHPPDAI
jgi:8-oxo-dGTP pyrophosphatase MutT (NUDIX family)